MAGIPKEAPIAHSSLSRDRRIDTQLNTKIYHASRTAGREQDLLIQALSLVKDYY